MPAAARHDPRQLDVADAAREGAALSGRWPVAALPRLAAEHPVDAPALADDVLWSARASMRLVLGGAAQVALQLQAETTVTRTCQRCLQPMRLPLVLDVQLRFVPGEDAAAALDADSEDDVLALEPRIDLRDLVEDELLLALPLVPRHDVCPQPLPRSAGEIEPAAHPFAALGALKKPDGAPPH